MTFKVPPFDRMSRYRYATFLFGVLYVMLMTRLWGWPDIPIYVLRIIWFGLTTPAMLMLGFNLFQEARQIYRKRKLIDHLLDQHTRP